jgi:hypothetical protein
MDPTLSWAQLWELIVQGNAALEHLANYAAILAFLGIFYNLYSLWRQRRRVRITVVSADAPEERKLVGKLPRMMVSRAEVMGFVAQAAGGERLDFRLFNFDYEFGRTVEVRLPGESYDAVVEQPVPAKEMPAG